MKLILILLFITELLSADIKHEMLSLYQNQKYEQVCTLGFNNFGRYKKDEEFVSLYAFGCLKADYIDRLAVPTAVLKFSEEARANSAYFAIILMQKKLLYHAMIDNIDLTELKLPTTDYVLSKVFNEYAKLKKDQKRQFYIFKDPKDNKISYKLYIAKDNRVSKMVIEEYYDTMLIKRHIYW
jgi:hypothetical protein